MPDDTCIVVLYSKLKKPLHPKVTIQVATTGDKDTPPQPIPILAAHVCDDKDNSLLLVHGHYLKPSFEKVVNIFTCSVCCYYEHKKNFDSHSLLKTVVLTYEPAVPTAVLNTALLCIKKTDISFHRRNGTVLIKYKYMD